MLKLDQYWMTSFSSIGVAFYKCAIVRKTLNVGFGLVMSAA